MTDPARYELGTIVAEAIAMHDRDGVSDAELARRVREHVLDRWYRLAPFGVTARAELEPIRAEITWTTSDARELAAWVHGQYREPTRRTTLHLCGTPLEVKPVSDPR